MFNVQRDFQNHEIYINYNEFLSKEEDESILTLEHMLKGSDPIGYKGVIDLITVKSLTGEEIKKIKEIHDILQNANIRDMDVVSDNKKVLERVKRLLPDIKAELFRIGKRR
jgi:hypothetical protein